MAAHLPGEIETAQGRSAIAITRDIAAGGLLVFTRLREVGRGANVKLIVVHNDKQIALAGTVVREEELEPGESTLWRTKLAIAIDNDPALAELFAALAAPPA